MRNHLSKTCVAFVCLLFNYFSSSAQSFPDKTFEFLFEVEAKDDRYELKIEAIPLEPDWHFWTVDLKSEFLIPTQIVFEDSASWQFLAPLAAEGEVAYIEDDFFGQVAYYKSNTSFYQEFKPVDSSVTSVSGYIIYQACNNTVCKPPEKLPFNIDLP